MLGLVLACFIMIAIVKVSFDILFGYRDVENAVLTMVLGSVLAIYVGVGLFLPGSIIF